MNRTLVCGVLLERKGGRSCGGKPQWFCRSVVLYFKCPLSIGLMSNFRHPPYPFPSGLGRGSRGQEDGPFHICVEWSRPLFPSGRGRGRITHLIALISLLGGSALALVESAYGNRFATGE
mgnify:CR=1 FL=1